MALSSGKMHQCLVVTACMLPCKTLGLEQGLQGDKTLNRLVTAAGYRQQAFGHTGIFCHFDQELQYYFFVHYVAEQSPERQSHLA